MAPWLIRNTCFFFLEKPGKYTWKMKVNNKVHVNTFKFLHPKRFFSLALLLSWLYGTWFLWIFGEFPRADQMCIYKVNALASWRKKKKISKIINCDRYVVRNFSHSSFILLLAIISWRKTFSAHFIFQPSFFSPFPVYTYWELNPIKLFFYWYFSFFEIIFFLFLVTLKKIAKNC